MTAMSEEQFVHVVGVAICAAFPDPEERETVMGIAMQRLEQRGLVKGDEVQLVEVILELGYLQRRRALMQLVMAICPENENAIRTMFGDVDLVSQTELAYCMGVSDSTVAGWVKSGMPVGKAG